MTLLKLLISATLLLGAEAARQNGPASAPSQLLAFRGAPMPLHAGMRGAGSRGTRGGNAKGDLVALGARRRGRSAAAVARQPAPEPEDDRVISDLNDDVLMANMVAAVSAGGVS
mmetsp:Transcript_71102/g.194841  ORF Transcript_71102/g.194841 Transcript_71102/m.194841 type:complete len:114 (+) Transcript_71102:45-386(+)|eukprot:5188813-Prymnesium_polylepis.1